jgi:P27 family predicted phage terminase small subunit
MNTRYKAPPKLGKWGRKLWLSTTKGARILEHDLQLLESACRLADRIQQCRTRLASEGLTVKGRYGQLVAHPLVEIERTASAEFRACLKLLGLHEQIPGMVNGR